VAPRPKWWHQLQASKQEALLAVDLYNRSGRTRQMEAFVVHMCMAWLKLLQARWERDRQDFYVRNARGWRERSRDGDYLTQPLQRMVEKEFAAADPRRKNLEFFIGLRNRIEHRYERDIATLLTGRTQALVLNFERTLTDCFGEAEGLAEELRLPVFVSSLTGDAVAALKQVRGRLPKRVLDYVQDFDAALDPGVVADQAYDFRVYLLPQTSSKTDADVAMSFVRLDDLTSEQRAEIERAQTIIREKQVPVEDLGGLLPGQVATRMAQALNTHFSITDHTECWRHFEVRPPTSSDHPERTKAAFCHYNAAFRQYVYTEAWVNFLVRKLADSDARREILGHDPPG
jgi:hypothetical protein